MSPAIMENLFQKLRNLDAYPKIIEDFSSRTFSGGIETPLQRHGGRLDHGEIYCGSCYGAEESDDHSCNSCEEVREAYGKKGWAVAFADLIDQCKREGFIQKVNDEEGEGYNIDGSLEVNKVPGNFHFAPGKSFQHAPVHVHDLLALPEVNYNVTLKEEHTSFLHFLTHISAIIGGVFTVAGIIDAFVYHGQRVMRKKIEMGKCSRHF